MKAVKLRAVANPPTQSEIAKARKTVTEIFKGEGVPMRPPVMETWEGVGWHKDEVFFGILIGLEIGRARRERKGSDDQRRA